MYKLLAKTSILFILLFLMLFILFLIFPNNEKLSNIQHKYKLLKNVNSPKIIVIGGSGTFYGVDCSLISKYYKVNAINAGLFAGFGLRFMLESIKSYLNTGDTLIIIPEYILFDEEHYYGDNYSFTFLSSYPELIIDYIKIYGCKRVIIDFIKIISIIQQDLKDKFLNFIYLFKKRIPDYDYYNDCADFILKLDKYKENVNFKEISINPKIDKRILFYLNEYYWYIKNKNINVLIYLPPFPYITYEKNKDELKLFEKNLKSQLSIPVVTNIEDQIYSEEYFYDSIFHLNTYGKEIRTKKIIRDISKYIFIN